MIDPKTAELARVLLKHRMIMPDDEWLSYYWQIGFYNTPEETDNERIWAAVQFDAAESGLMPGWFYEA